MDNWDVIIVGGGVSGCIAALAAARMGAKTLIVEKYGFLGGTLTNSGVGPMMTFHAGSRQVIGGIPQELVERLIKNQASTGHIEDTTGYASSVTPFDSEQLKSTLDDMMKESNVDVLFHAQIVSTIKEENRIIGISVITCAGILELFGKVFIDATGNADLSYMAGAKTFLGREEDGLCQPMTTNMRIRDVDIDTIKEQIRKNPNNFRNINVTVLDRSPRLSLAGFYKEFDEAKNAGMISTNREDVLFFETSKKNEIIVNTTRIIRKNPTDPWQLSEAEAEGRRQANELFSFFKQKIRGFEKSVYVSSGTQIGIRESRRVEGEYILTGEDLLSSERFEDTIALGGYPIDIHNPTGKNTKTEHLKDGQFYYIPLRSIEVKGLDNLIVSGRCISCTHEACAAIRVTPIAMAIGQAAGCAAAECVLNGGVVRNIDYSKVKEALLGQRAILE